MNTSDIFVFGTKIFPEIKQDAISSLPLELSWKIFSYLDDKSLRIATRTYKIWNRIILSEKKLRDRLNRFELAVRLGSEKLASVYRRHKMKLKIQKKKNYVPVGESKVRPMKKSSGKRVADDIVITSKRFKLF